MQPSNQPSNQPSRRQASARRVLAGLTALMTTGIVIASCAPSSGPEKPPGGQPATVTESRPTPLPAPTPAPADTEQPKPTPEPAPAPPEPAPAPQPEGEISVFVEHGDRSCKQIAFTYDAGSGADGAAAILDMLKKHNLHVTFFLTGKWAEQYPDLAKRIVAEGHEIGNHSYSHPDLTAIPADEALQQITRADEVIRQITGRSPRPFFREPFGAFNKAERGVVYKAGYTYSIYWDVDTVDWKFPGVEAEFKTLTEKTKNGSIVLMHLNVPDSATASDRAIPVLEARGYKIVPVSQVLKCP